MGNSKGRNGNVSVSKNNLQPWDRQNETEKAWEAFVLYRDMGMDRTLQKLSEVTSKDRNWLAQWKVRYKWEERVSAYDTHLDQLKRHAAEDEIVAIAKKQARLGESMQGLAAMGIGKLAIRNKETGEMFLTRELTGQEISALAKNGVDIQRKARGMKDDASIQVNVDNHQQTLQIILNGEDLKKVIETARACGIESSIVTIEGNGRADNHNGKKSPA